MSFEEPATSNAEETARSMTETENFAAGEARNSMSDQHDHSSVSPHEPSQVVPAGAARDPINDADEYSTQRWRAERLHMLAGLSPLLPGASNKRPLVGNEWQKHPGLSIAQLQQETPCCICWHVGADPGHIAVDIDGPAASALCIAHGCDPATVDTWRIVRTSNSERLKLVFKVTPEQKAILVAGAVSVKKNGEELAVFARPGKQIVVLGDHHAKDGTHDDQYAWAGKPPADAQPIPPEWMALLVGVFCGDRPLRPATARAVTTYPKFRPAGRSGGGNWSNSSQRQPCPVCGRDHSGACSIAGDGNSVWCCHGQTFSAPDCSTAGQTVKGTDGRNWGYVRTEEHDSFGERSLFVLDQPRDRQQTRAAAPAAARSTPAGESPSRNGSAPAGGQEEEEDAALDAVDRLAEIQSFRDAEAMGALVTPHMLFPPGLAEKVSQYAQEQQLAEKGFYLPIQCAVASVIGNRVVAVPEIGSELKGIGVLWGLNVAPVSGGKSPTSKPTIETPLLPWHLKEREKQSAALKEWERGKRKAEAEAKGLATQNLSGGDDDPVGTYLKENPEPQRRHILATDATFERLEIIVNSSQTPGVLVFHDEMGRWFSQLTRTPSQSDREKWLGLYPGSPVLTERVGREEVAVARPAVSLFGNLQPARIAGLWATEAKLNEGCPDADGLWSRFLLVNLPEWDYTYRKTVTKLAPVLEHLYREVDRAVAALPLQEDKPHELALEPAALELFSKWTADLLAMRKARQHEEDKGFIEKQRGNTLRLALVLHAIDCASRSAPMNQPISLRTLHAAIAETCLFITERDQLLGAIRAGDGAGAIKRLLAKGREWRRKHGPAPVPFRTVREWSLPERRATSSAVRQWLRLVVPNTPGCGSLQESGRSLTWTPPGDQP